MNPWLSTTKRYDFKTFSDSSRVRNERLLVCPRCKQTLTQPDIENFTSCPFCNYRFQLNTELEDFILEPVVENWIRLQSTLTPNFRSEDFLQNDF